MKYIFNFLIVTLSFNYVNAKSMFDGMSKEELANYEILVFDKRDKMIKGRMSRVEYKVVKIEETPQNKDIKIEDSQIKILPVIKKPSKFYTSIILHGGIGYKGLAKTEVNNTYDVYEKRAIVSGITGCETQSSLNLGICVSGFTNSLFTLGIKFDYN